MEKKIIEINGKQITIMEQPASFILDLERRLKRTQVVDYTKEILKYPSGINPNLSEIINVPSKFTSKDLEVPYSTSDEGLYVMEELFQAGINGYVFLGEKFVKKAGKQVDDFKYRELEEIGEEVAKQIAEISICGFIISTFRGM